MSVESEDAEGGCAAVPGVTRVRWKYDHAGLRKVVWCRMCVSFSLRLRFLSSWGEVGGIWTSAAGASAMVVSARGGFDDSGAMGGAAATVPADLEREMGPIVSSSVPMLGSAVCSSYATYREGSKLQLGALTRTFERSLLARYVLSPRTTWGVHCAQVYSSVKINQEAHIICGSEMNKMV